MSRNPVHNSISDVGVSNRYTTHMSPMRAITRYVIFLLYCGIVYMILFTTLAEDTTNPTVATTSTSTNQTETVSPPVPTATPQSETATNVNFNGTFESRAHSGAGTATITTVNGKRVLTLSEDFETGAGPDLNVYISNVNNPETSAELHSGSYADLGTLKNTTGAQTYDIPATVDFNVQNVVVYCVSFKVIFTLANLTTL